MVNCWKLFLRVIIYLKKTVSYFNDYNRDRFIAEVAQHTPPRSKILDAGAGSCKYKPLFVHCDYKAQDFCDYKGEDVKYGDIDYSCDVTDIPVTNDSFDYIICTEVLEHTPRPDLVLREFSRILKNGGKLVLTAPLGSGIHMPPYHFYGGFTPYWYEHFLQQYGFEIESCRANGGFFKLYGQESQRFLFMITPQNSLGRFIFFPLKVVLAVWFKLMMPFACYFLDHLDKGKEFTVGYFVVAKKKDKFNYIGDDKVVCNRSKKY